MHLLAKAEWPYLLLSVSCVLAFVGLASGLFLDVLVADWDLFLRVRYPGFTARNRVIACATILLGAPVLILSSLLARLSLAMVVALAATASPFVWFFALSRRGKPTPPRSDGSGYDLDGVGTDQTGGENLED